MDYIEFEKKINSIAGLYKWMDELYDNTKGIINFTSDPPHEITDCALILYSDLKKSFKDDEDLIGYWVFECKYATEEGFITERPDLKISSTRDLYNILIEKQEKRMNLTT